MSLTDQHLRQELMSFGESVPPITQRNREQLRARLDVLRAQPRPRPTSSPSRSRANTSASRQPTRSRPVPGLIELSDSDTDTPSADHLLTGGRSSAQTRSIAVRSPANAKSPLPTGKMTVDVEQSSKFIRSSTENDHRDDFDLLLVARHRREIQNMIDSARERVLSRNSSVSSPAAHQPAITPFRPSSSSSDYKRSKPKSEPEKVKQPSWFDRSGQAIRTFWKTHRSRLIDTFKALLLGTLIGGTLILLKSKGSDLIPHRKGTPCDLPFRASTILSFQASPVPCRMR